MRTKEFIERVQDMGYCVGVVGGSDVELCVCGNNDNVVLVVNTKDTFNVSTDWHEFKRLDDETKEKLLSVALEYVKTPIDKRKEPKKYYLMLPDPVVEWSSYLNYDTENEEFSFSHKTALKVKTQFTQEEIDKLPNQDFIQSLIKEQVK